MSRPTGDVAITEQSSDRIIAASGTAPGGADACDRRPPCGRFVVVGEGAAGELRVGGMLVGDRLARAVRRATRRAGGRGAGLVLVAGDAVIDDDHLVALSAAAARGAAIVAGDDVRTPAALALPRAPERVPGDADALGELAQRLDREGRLQRVEVRGVCRRVRDGRQARRATRDLLAQMWRPTDGFFARHFDRYLSTAMSPWFVRWGVRPNTITLVATAVGLLGAVLLAQVRAAASVAGALLVVASTILDGCDGEVARISLRASPNGRRLDLLGDNVVNVAVFAAVGFHVVASEPAMVWVSTAAVLGIVVAAATGLWFSTWLDRAGLGERARAWYERASSRDFVYLVFALAVCDRLQWFVWMSAFGSFAFAAGLVVLRVGIDRHRRRSRAYKTVRGDV